MASGRNFRPEALTDFLKNAAPWIQKTPLETGDRDEKGQSVLKYMYRTNLDAPQRPEAEAVPRGNIDRLIQLVLCMLFFCFYFT